MIYPWGSCMGVNMTPLRPNMTFYPLHLQGLIKYQNSKHMRFPLVLVHYLCVLMPSEWCGVYLFLVKAVGIVSTSPFWRMISKKKKKTENIHKIRHRGSQNIHENSSTLVTDCGKSMPLTSLYFYGFTYVTSAFKIYFTLDV